jgi:hypothetical protein
MLHSWVKKLNQWMSAGRTRKQTSRRKATTRKSGQARLSLEGLEDRLMPALVTPAFVVAHPSAGGTGATPAFTPAGYSPLQIRTAYGINSSTATGAGQTIAIVDAFNDPKISSDLDVFDKQFSATSSGSTLYQQYGAAASFLTVYNQSGQAVNPGNTSVPVDSSAGWETEEALDVEWAHAIAPRARIALVEANDNSGNLYTAVGAAAHLPGVSVVSMSWGGGDFAGETAHDSTFTTPAGHAGVTFLASTGDSGSASYPATSPNVVAVGGTTLTLNADNTIKSENTWSGTGAGPSAFESEPSYQHGFQNTGKRTVPDVSFDADPNTGVAVYDSFGTAVAPAPGWIEVGGTSLSAPAWAGLIALAYQQRAQAGMTTLDSSSPTQTQSLLYGLSVSAFHDITTGSVTTNGHTYHAGVGYDEVTGLGSPAANRIADGLSGTLDIVGDQSAVNQNDSYVIGTTASGGLQITIDGKTESLPAGSIRTINLTGNGGANSVVVKALPASVTLNLDNITTNHNDTVTVGGFASSLSNVAGTVKVSNSSGSTALSVDGSADGLGRTYQVRSNSVKVSGMPGVVDYYGDVNALNITGGSGNDTMDVFNTSANVPVNLNTGLGVNNVLVYGSSSAVSVTGDGTNHVTIGANGSLVGITGPVNVSNYSNPATGIHGKSFVTIDDTTDPAEQNVTINGSSIAYQGGPTINLTSDVAGVVINDSLHQANHYTVDSVQPGDPVTINGDILDSLSGPAAGQVTFNSHAHS